MVPKYDENREFLKARKSICKKYLPLERSTPEYTECTVNDVLVDPYLFNAVWIDQNKKGYGSTRRH